MAQFAPSAFGKYFLVDKIATGGMAEIFKAKSYGHGGFESLLVIKRILPHVGKNEDFVEMFVDEAKVSVALQHPNIVRVFDFGKQADNYFIAMECVEGKDARGILKKHARRGNLIPWMLAATIAHETCRGLQYAHTKTDLHGMPYDIVHRDISPSNILVGYDGQVKIADFGIAKAASNAYETRDGVLKGKFEYMSPEQAGGTGLDHRSDQFAVGILLWEMLTGKRLFKTDNDLATLREITEGTIVPPSTYNSSISSGLDAVVMTALARKPEDRYPDMGVMAEDLRTAMRPHNPEGGRDRLAIYMSELFGAERAEEIRRLDANSAVAERMRQSGDWDQQETSIRSSPQSPRLVSTLLLLLLVGVGTASLAVGGVVVYVRQSVVDTQRLGAIDVVVEPAATVFVDGSVRGTGMTVVVSRLEPGDHLLRLEADGHESVEHTVRVSDGQAVRYETVLTPIASAAIDEEDALLLGPNEEEEVLDADHPPRLRIGSAPGGATVSIGGSVVGKTPYMHTGSPGESVSLRLELKGYVTRKGTAILGEHGTTTRYARTLTKATEPGSLAVLLVGGGWANVYIDGEKLSKTAPLRGVDIEVGPHEIRVENAALGIEHTQSVTVESGQAVTVRASPN